MRGAAQYRGAVVRGRVAPGGKGLCSRGDRPFDLLGAGQADAADDLLRVGRIERLERLRGTNILAADVQGVRIAEMFADLGDAGGEGFANRAAREVRRRFVDKRRDPRRCALLVLVCPRRRGGLFGRVLQEGIDVRFLDEALAQERLVGGVLQQAAHQVGHAGDHLAVGAVEAHPPGDLEQALAHRFGHAVEDLEFVAFFGDAEGLGCFQDGGDRADVVRAAGEVHPFVVFQQQARLALEGGVGGRLFGVNGNRPAVLAGADRLVIPVGALDQAHADRQTMLAGPGDELRDVFVRVLEIGLQGDAQMGVVGILATQAAVEIEGEVLALPRLHVEAQVAADGDDLVADAAQPLENPLQGLFGGLRPHLRVEGARFDRHLQGRGMPPVETAVAVAQCRPLVPVALKFVEQVEIGGGVLVCFPLVDGRLAEDVEHEAESLAAQLRHRLQRLAGILPGDELAPHLLDIAADHLAEHGAAEFAGLARELGAGAQKGGQLPFLVAEVLADVSGQAVAALQGGKDVDEAEHLRFERLIRHAPVEHRADPPVFVEQRRFLAGDAAVEFAAPFDDALVEFPVGHGRLPRRFRCRCVPTPHCNSRAGQAQRRDGKNGTVLYCGPTSSRRRPLRMRIS